MVRFCAARWIVAWATEGLGDCRVKIGSKERVLAVAEQNLPDTVEVMLAYNDELRKLITQWEANQ